MIELTRILAPIDFSDHSRLALDHAVAIARWYDATVTLLHVVQPLEGLEIYSLGALALGQSRRDELLAELRRFAADESAGAVPIESRLREGRPIVEILKQADEMQADLLVLGSHGRSGIDRLLLGSVTEKALRRATCPVLVVPRRQADAVPGVPPLFREILCPVDFSESSLKALAYAMSMAEEADARLTVLHAVAREVDEADVPALLAAASMNLSVAEFNERREREVWSRLEALVPTAVQAAATVKTAVKHGRPWHTILQEAAECHADLIVMGVQGRGAVDLMWMGSTTQQVVRQATCPVLTLRVH
jgi:nucleotide-binding universal stress UspA family protein